MIKKLYLTIAAIALLAAAGFAEEPVITMTTTTKGTPFSFYLRGATGSSITVDFGVGTPVTQKLTGESSSVTFTSTANLTADATEIKVYGSGIVCFSVVYKLITAVDVTRCSTLSVFYCSDNSLSTLDVSKNLALKELICSRNKLTLLDVSQNALLACLDCSNNQLSLLKLNSNSSFYAFYCNKNKLDFASLPVPSSKIPRYYYAPQAAIKLPKVKIAVGESIDLSRYASAADANGAAKPTVFTWKTVAGEKLIEGVDYTVNAAGVFTIKRDVGNYIICELSNLVFPAFTGEDIIKTFAVQVGEVGQPLAIVMTMNVLDDFKLKLSGYVGIPVTVDYGTSGKVTKNLEGEETWVDFASPQSLDGNRSTVRIFGNGITGVDFPDSYSASGNSDFTLDVTNNPCLKHLNCGPGGIKTLDLSKNLNLVYLDCSGNELTSLDLSKNKLLTSLDCGYNKLLSLDISHNESLKSIDCRYNRLSSLVLHNSAQYGSIDCSYNLFDYTTLPLPNSRINRYVYEPQRHIPQQKPIIALGETVDLSRFLMVKDASNVEHSTTFTWKKHTGELLVEGTDYTRSGGVFTFKQEGLAYCELSNAVFPKLAGENILKTANVLVGEQPFAFSMTTIKKGSFNFSLRGVIGSPITVKYSNGVSLTKNIEEFENTFTCPAELTADATDVKVYGRGIKSINVDRDQGLSSIDVSQLASLEEFYCAANKLTTLDVSKNLALRSLACNYNQLNSISLNRDNKFVYLSIDGNRLTFATLPQLNNQWKNTYYAGQRVMLLPKASYVVGEAIDLSSQLSAKDVDGNVQTTIYGWYNSKNEMLSPINDYTESNGVFTFKQAIADMVYCHMSNHAYPDFDKDMNSWFRTEFISIGATGISEGTADAVKVYVSNGTVVVEGLRGGEAISVVNMLGSVVHQSVASGSSVTISLPVHGLYVVRVGISAHKVAW